MNCEDGVEVGSLARALLAMYFVGLERYDEAERPASEVTVRFPASVDTAGAPARRLLPALKPAATVEVRRPRPAEGAARVADRDQRPRAHQLQGRTVAGAFSQPAESVAEAIET